MEEDYKKITIDSYNKNAKEFSEKFREFMDLEKRSEFEIILKYSYGKKILDMGCGAGDNSVYFKNSGFEVTAIDLSESMVDLCKKKGIDAQIMDIENLSFQNNSFDIVWAVTSLLHIPKSNIEDVFRNVSNILKKDGVFHFSLKEGDGEGFIDDKENNTKRYFAFWRKEELLEVFNKYFELIEFKEVQMRKTKFLMFFLRNNK